MVNNDYVYAWPHLIAVWLPGRFTSLGADGFGRSDTRPALRRFFEVDRYHITLTAEERIPACAVTKAIAKYDIDPEKNEPWSM